jgi:orotate phosphoribosyltransferase
MDYASEVAKAGLEIGAIKLNAEDPFQWASGYKMPIYNDNRMFLLSYENRSLIKDGFIDLLENNNIHWKIIAGTSTSGIPPATTLSDITNSPLIYVRDKPKSHGLKNQIEGIDANSDLEGKNVILIEDLISTGGSSAKAVQGIRNANGKCDYCLSIFDYGFDKANDMFKGLEPYDKDGNKLNPACKKNSILTYDKLLETAIKTEYINMEQMRMLEDWRKDPFGWGEKNGFPRVEK